VVSGDVCEKLFVPNCGTGWRLRAAAALTAVVVGGVARAELATEPAAESTADAAPKSAAELQAAYQRLDANFRHELSNLAFVAYGKQWPKLGEMAQSWQPERPATGSLLFIAPDQYGGQAEPAVPAEPSDATQLWLDEFTKLRDGQADALFALAREAAEAGQLSLAIGWATEAVRDNPDHADARRVLGYELADGQWLTAYAKRMVDGGKVWRPRYGWISQQDVPRYEAGQRPSGGRWIPAERDARRRGRQDEGWQVRTDHFLVSSNDSLEAAAGLAARLEKLYQVWQQLFAGFYLTDREVRELFAGERRARQQSQPFRVFYHRDKDDYVAALASRQPRIAETLGIYFDTDSEAHFFAGKGQDAGTLYHEAVHQLFQESRPAARRVGERANFWIVEGIATYFETLCEHELPGAGPYYTIGESSAGRLPAARQRLLSEGYYVPLQELTQLNQDQVQQRPDIAKLYSQASGLAAFLMDGEGGRYREPLVRYLVAVYGGRDDQESLATETGRNYSQLDAQYRRTMESLP
jgi:hypothetical protein